MVALQTFTLLLLKWTFISDLKKKKKSVTVSTKNKQYNCIQWNVYCAKSAYSEMIFEALPSDHLYNIPLNDLFFFLSNVFAGQSVKTVRKN